MRIKESLSVRLALCTFVYIRAPSTGGRTKHPIGEKRHLAGVGEKIIGNFAFSVLQKGSTNIISPISKKFQDHLLVLCAGLIYNHS